MKILEIRVMRGPNLWSIRRHQLILMRLDLQEMEKIPTSKIDGFAQRLEKLIPTIQEHHCSVGRRGGFLQRVRQGTWLGHVVEHVALEIQCLAGMECVFGRTRGTGEHGVYNVIFSYKEERVGIYAAKAAVKIVKAIADGKSFKLAKVIQTMRELREAERLGPSTGSLVDEAKRRGIPYIRLNKHSLVQLGYGINQKRIQATVTSQTSSIGAELACDKEQTKNLLSRAGIPVPAGTIVYSEEDVKGVVKSIGFPLVVKPVDANQGKGATINVKNIEDAMAAFNTAKRYSARVIVEKFIAGFDFRLLVINYKFIAAAMRTPALVVGNGKSTIKELIKLTNQDPRRGYGHEKSLTEIVIDQMTRNILKKKELTVDSVLPKGEILHLKTTANLSTGGTSKDVTHLVHPYNVFTAERISRVIGLDICGIDIMAPDITNPINENGGTVLEVNAAPGFRMHLAPTEGWPRNVAEPVIDMLYPPGISSGIPIIAVTGTNGKTTTVRLISHIMKTIGRKVGYSTSNGIYIQNRMLLKGDCSGPASAEFVLQDPTVDIAVLECARGGILRAGLGFNRCNIGIVTNVASDHLGLKDINTLEQLAKVKSVVVESVHRDGYGILNADDDLVFNMKKSLNCNVALFSMNERNPRIVEHCKDGGIAAIYENGYITINKGGWKIRIDKVSNMPLTFSGTAVFMIQNILPAVLTGFLRNIKIDDLRLALQTFIPSPAQTPGRLNIFEFQNFKVMLDDAHNPAGLIALGKFLEKYDDSPKIGVISGTGDRRDKDIMEFGAISAELFDEIVIRQDSYLRGRTRKAIVDLLIKGIRKKYKKKPVTVIYNEKEAITTTINNAKKGSFITIVSGIVPEAINTVIKLKEKESKVKILKADIPNIN